MTECQFCYNDLDKSNIVINIYNDNTSEESKMCLHCNIMLIENILPNLLNSIALETCEASIKRIVKKDLPTHLSIDGTGRGKQINKIIFDNMEISCKLKCPEYVNIEEINKSMKYINELVLNDDDIYLYIKEETFRSYKK